MVSSNYFVIWINNRLCNKTFFFEFLDIFHTDCLESHYRSLPSNTAPAGYKCYTCDSPIFPALNQAGRVVDILKETLANFSWARVGLGLPLVGKHAGH